MLYTFGSFMTFCKAERNNAEQRVKNILEGKKGKGEKRKEKTLYPVPYTYTGEDFLDDCRELIGKISSKYISTRIDPLGVLIAIKRFDVPMLLPYISLHKIDCFGNEQEIKDGYTCTGSGSPYVDIFFDKWFDNGKRTLVDIIKFGSFVIKFVEKKVKGSGVGVEEGNLPQIVIFFDNGKRGPYMTTQKDELLRYINEKLGSFDSWGDDLKLNFPKIDNNTFVPIPYA